MTIKGDGRDTFKVKFKYGDPEAPEDIDWSAGKTCRYLVLELGEIDLGAFMENYNEEERLPEGIAKQLMKQMLEGIHYMHENYLAHKDIKPQNMILTKKGDLRVIDFGEVIVCRRDDEIPSKPEGVPKF